MEPVPVYRKWSGVRASADVPGICKGEISVQMKNNNTGFVHFIQCNFSYKKLMLYIAK